VCDGDGVYLYDETRYRGRCIKLTGDEDDLSDLGFNNIAESIRVRGGYTATLFVDQGYQGFSSTFTADDPDLAEDGIGNNRASSIRVRRGAIPEENRCGDERGEGIYLYEDLDFRGNCLRFTRDERDLSSYAFADTASSLRIRGAFTATLYADTNFGGVSSTFTADDRDLSDNAVGENHAASLRVQRGAAVAGVGDCDGGLGAYLYEHPQFAGRCVKFTANVGDLRPLGFDDAASSVRVVGGGSVVLFRDLNGTGISTIYTQDDANIGDDSIGDNQVTSIAVQLGTGSPVASQCDGGAGVYLYEHPQFAGRCVRVAADALDLRVLGFDDIASSVRVVGSFTATLARDLGGTGVTSTFSGDDANLADDAVGDNQVTSVVVRPR
jgi:hypothetical protein